MASALRSLHGLGLLLLWGFPGGASGKEPACQCRKQEIRKDSPGGGHGNPLQYSCLENPCDRSQAGYSPRGRKESDTTKVT